MGCPQRIDLICSHAHDVYLLMVSLAHWLSLRNRAGSWKLVNYIGRGYRLFGCCAEPDILEGLAAFLVDAKHTLLPHLAPGSMSNNSLLDTLVRVTGRASVVDAALDIDMKSEGDVGWVPLPKCAAIQAPTPPVREKPPVVQSALLSSSAQAWYPVSIKLAAVFIQKAWRKSVRYRERFSSKQVKPSVLLEEEASEEDAQLAAEFDKMMSDPDVVACLSTPLPSGLTVRQKADAVRQSMTRDLPQHSLPASDPLPSFFASDMRVPVKGLEEEEVARTTQQEPTSECKSQ